MQLCRELFPTILEKDGELFKLIDSLFSYNRFLYEDIVKYDKISEFKDYVYERYDDGRKNTVETTKTPRELLKEAGYNLYECYTEDDIQKFKKYYADGEELCTFSGGRLNTCYVFFAVKENAMDIKREDFIEPNREDEYGTSVISIQYSKGDYNSLSIKNRYNHTVVNPDATFSNDLDRIIPGLNEAFEKAYHLSNVYDYHGFVMPGYVVANDGKMYKYNYEINNIYYCINNIIIDNFNVIDKYKDKEKYILLDYFIIDLMNKEVRVYEGNKKKESFPDSFKNIKRIKIVKGIDRDNKYIDIIHDNMEETIIEMNKYNQMMKLYDEHIKSSDSCYLEHDKYLIKLFLPNIENIGGYSLMENKVLEKLYIPNVKRIGAFFLQDNIALDVIRMDQVKEIGGYFLTNNNKIKNIYLPNVEIIKKNFMSNNNEIRTVVLPKAWEVGDYFLENNTCLEQVLMPKVLKIGVNFLLLNKNLREISLPNVKEIGDNFLGYNTEIRRIDMPQLECIDNYFMTLNNHIVMLDLPNVVTIGNAFLQHNQVLEYLYLPKLQVAGNNFLTENNAIYELDLPEIRKCKYNFFSRNKIIRRVNMPKVEDIYAGFLYENQCLEEITLPMVKYIGTGFLKNNHVLKRIVVPSELIDSKDNESSIDRELFWGIQEEKNKVKRLCK